jgi:hypothetical protein
MNDFENDADLGPADATELKLLLEGVEGEEITKEIPVGFDTNDYSTLVVKFDEENRLISGELWVFVGDKQIFYKFSSVADAFIMAEPERTEEGLGLEEVVDENMGYPIQPIITVEELTAGVKLENLAGKVYKIPPSLQNIVFENMSIGKSSLTIAFPLEGENLAVLYLHEGSPSEGITGSFILLAEGYSVLYSYNEHEDRFHYEVIEDDEDMNPSLDLEELREVMSKKSRTVIDSFSGEELSRASERDGLWDFIFPLNSP